MEVTRQKRLSCINLNQGGFHEERFQGGGGRVARDSVGGGGIGNGPGNGLWSWRRGGRGGPVRGSHDGGGHRDGHQPDRQWELRDGSGWVDDLAGDPVSSGARWRPRGELRGEGDARRGNERRLFNR